MSSTGMRFLRALGAMLLIMISSSCREGRAQQVTSVSNTNATVVPLNSHEDSDNYHSGSSGGKDDDHDNDDDDDYNSSDEWWPIVVGVLGGLAAAVVITIVIVVALKRHRKRQQSVHDSTTSLQQQQQRYQVTGVVKKNGSLQEAKIADPPPAYPEQLRIDVEALKQTESASSAPILPPSYDDSQNVHQHLVQIMPGCNVTFYENKLEASVGDVAAAKS